MSSPKTAWVTCQDPVLNKNKSFAESLYRVTLWKCMLPRSAAFTDGKGGFHCCRKYIIPIALAKAWTGKADPVITCVADNPQP